MTYNSITTKTKKYIRSLHQKKYRDESGLFILEGKKICAEAFAEGMEIECAVVINDADADLSHLAKKIAFEGIEVFSADGESLQYISDAQTPQGIVFIARKRNIEQEITDNFIALEGVSDPGNLGTIIRTADWFGFKNIILDKNCADIYAPKVVRATMGSIIRENILQINNISEYLKQNFVNFEFYGASLKGKVFLSDCTPQNNFGLIFGNESKGLSAETEQILSCAFLIKGYGGAESLNVAVSAGIALNHFAHVRL